MCRANVKHILQNVGLRISHPVMPNPFRSLVKIQVPSSNLLWFKLWCQHISYGFFYVQKWMCSKNYPSISYDYHKDLSLGLQMTFTKFVCIKNSVYQAWIASCELKVKIAFITWDFVMNVLIVISYHFWGLYISYIYMNHST